MKVNQNLTTGESLAVRGHFVASTIIDTAETVIKVCATVVSGVLSGLFLGQSKTINEWTIAHYNDMKISAKMTWFAAKGVFKPSSSSESRDGLDVQGVHKLGQFKYEHIRDMNFFEKMGVRLQFIANIFKEMLAIITSGLRYVSSRLCLKIKPDSETFKQMNWNDFKLLSTHITSLFGSLQGVVRPRWENSKMIKKFDVLPN